MLADWRSLIWQPGLRGALWRDVRALFAEARLSPDLAARFLAEQAAALGTEGVITLREHFDLFKVCALTC